MSLFKKKSTKDKVADQVEPLAERAAEVGNQIGSLVKDSVRAAVNWAEPLAAEAYEKAAPLVKDAAEKARPYVADATARYEETSALVREDYLPRAKRAAQAALDEARSNSGDLTSRANAVLAASKKELAKPEKKKRGLRKWIGFLAVAGAGAAAAYAAWARSRPVQDPWAEAYWEDVSVPSDEPADSAAPAGAAADATTAKEKVEEQAAEHEVIKEDISEAELKEEELKEKVEKTREEEAAEAAGILKED